MILDKITELLGLSNTQTNKIEIKNVFKSAELSQGIQYLKDKKFIYNNVKTNSRIIEGLETINSETNNLLQTLAKNQKDELNVLESKFNSALQRYSTLSQTIYQEQLNGINTKLNKNQIEVSNDDEAKKQELEQINNELMDYASQIYNKIANMQDIINDLQLKEGQKDEYLDNQLIRFKGLFNKYNTLNKSYPTLNAMVEDSVIQEKYEYSRYIMYTIAALIILLTTHKLMRHK